jgi:hypothetical protein
VKLYLALAGFALASCAEPTAMEIINTDLNHERAYSHYIRKVNEAWVLKPGEARNCTDIAFTKKQALAKAGVHSIMFACNLKSGKDTRFCFWMMVWCWITGLTGW